MNISRRLFIIFRNLPVGLQARLSKIIYRPKLGKNVSLFGTIQFGPEVMIDDYSYIHAPAYVAHTSIGKFCSIGKNLSIITSNHVVDNFSTYPFANYITRIDQLSKTDQFRYFQPIPPIAEKTICEIGNDVWIGENVTILRGVTIGNGVVIGANSLVTHDLPDYCIAVGTPAKVLRYRFDKKTVYELQKTQWWNWEMEKIVSEFDSLNQLVKPDN